MDKIDFGSNNFQVRIKNEKTNFYWKKRKSHSSSGKLQHSMLSFEWQLYHLDYISKILPCEHVRCLTVGITGCMQIWTVKLPSILFSISILSAIVYFIHCSLLYINSLYSQRRMVSDLRAIDIKQRNHSLPQQLLWALCAALHRDIKL